MSFKGNQVVSFATLKIMEENSLFNLVMYLFNRLLNLPKVHSKGVHRDPQNAALYTFMQAVRYKVHAHIAFTHIS